MENLFAFLARDRETHPLVKACVFHYELEFIHPFSDGNGRAGRLWQHVIASAYDPVFLHVPIESLIKEHQKAYYDVLAKSDKAADSRQFGVFMLQKMSSALQRLVAAAAQQPSQRSPVDRLEAARAHFGTKLFSRSQYRTLHPRISAPTASRDLRAGVDRGWLIPTGEKATTVYAFKRR